MGDSTPGDTRGQGPNQFGALWYVLGAAGNAATSSSSKAKATPTTSAPSYAY